MANNEVLGASFSIDVTNLKAGLAQANRMIRESESEFKAAAAGMDNWQESQKGLEARIKHLNSAQDLQKEKIKALNEQYEKAGYAADDMSAAAIKLRTDINKEKEALAKTETELKKQKQALENLGDESKEAGEATEEMGNKFEGLKAAGGIAASAIAAVGAACVAAVGAFLGLAESTREARTNMAKLETSFETAGLSAEDASNTFTELYSVLGDEGKATEAAQQLAKISQDEEDLAANTRILTGVMAEYGESIPTEGLAEGMAATAAMGEVQGVLADALEWQGVNLEEYNEQLATLATEEERAAYIQSTLTDLYGASADAYRENNAEIIAAQKAQAGLNEAMNELGAIAEPIMTTLKTLATDLLTTITPFVALMGEGLAGALSGADGAADSLAEGLSGILETAVSTISDMLPFIVDTVVLVVPKLLQSLMAQLPTISVALIDMIARTVSTLLPVLLAQLPMILQTLISMVSQIATKIGEMLPTLIPVIIDTLIMLVETLLDNVDMIIDAGISLLLGLAEGLMNALPQLVAKIPVIIQKLLTALLNNLPKLLRAGVQILLELGKGLVQAIPQLLSSLPQIISSIVTGFASYKDEVKGIGKDLIKGLWNGIKDMGSWIAKKIKGFGEGVLDGLKDFFGIHSPSKVMADEIGKNLALGIGQGFEKNIAGVNDTITGAMNIASNVGQVGNVGGGYAAGGVVVYQTNHYSQAHSRLELYKTKQATAAAVRLAMTGA